MPSKRITKERNRSPYLTVKTDSAIPSNGWFTCSFLIRPISLTEPVSKTNLAKMFLWVHLVNWAAGRLPAQISRALTPYFKAQLLISGSSLAEVGIGAKSGSYSSPYVVGIKYNFAFWGACAGMGERNRSNTGWPGISSWLLEIGEKVMVWKIGSTDKSIVVMRREFLLAGHCKSFKRTTGPHPKGWLWIAKFELSVDIVRCLSCLLKNLKFKLEC